MNKILVEVSVGELLDKLSILEIKKEKIKDHTKLNFINDEYNILKEQVNKNLKSDEKLENLFQSLKVINSKLWVIEDNKRLCEKTLILEKNLSSYLEMFIFLMTIELKLNLKLMILLALKLKKLKSILATDS